jgi:predicted HAD superfamily Cof-like phosphohydrolase
VSLVRQFHLAFDIPVQERPTIPYVDRVRLRRDLIIEEYKEVMVEFALIEDRLAQRHYQSAAVVYRDLSHLAKELADLRYVGEGAELEFGIPGQAVYEEVHRSNMSKLGKDGRPIRRWDGKVLKGPDYHEADILSVLGVVEGSAVHD